MGSPSPKSERLWDFTAIYQPVPDGYIGFIEELPGANTQGATLEETRRNLYEAVALILAAANPRRCPVCGCYQFIYKGDRQVCADCGHE
jgi:predicted RNase H-like HicB family nuclease